MWPKLVFCIFLMLFPIAMVIAQEDGAGDQGAKMVSGMSILGNKEAPMSLFIVPWKTSELGAETNLTRTLNERNVPVDREVFMREVSFYEVSAGDRSGADPAAFKLIKSH